MGLMMSNRLASDANLSYDQLGTRLHNVFQQYEIGRLEWDILRTHGVKTMDDGNAYMITDAIEELDDQIIKDYLASKGVTKTTKRSINEAREKLASDLDTFFLDRADHGIPMPGAAERAIMNQGTQAGTAWGEVVRHVMQFKSFPVTMIRRGLGREMKGQMVARQILWALHNLWL